MNAAPKLALFDLDNTLLDGDSDYAWAQFLIEEGVLHPAEYNAKNEYFYERYKDGTAGPDRATPTLAARCVARAVHAAQDTSDHP